MNYSVELAPFQISDSTFDLLRSSPSFELRRRRRTVGVRTEKISRAQESSLDPLSRSFPSFLDSPRLPRSPLLRFADMQDQSTVSSTPALRPPQLITAIFPVEIVDYILSQIAGNGTGAHVVTRDKTLQSSRRTGPSRRGNCCSVI